MLLLVSPALYVRLFGFARFSRERVFLILLFRTKSTSLACKCLFAAVGFVGSQINSRER